MKIHLLFLTLTFVLFFQKSYAQNNDIDERAKYHDVNISILNIYKQFPIVAIGEGQHNSALTFEWLIPNGKWFDQLITFG